MTDYIAIVLNGFFTGFGVIVAQHLYELYFKHKVERVKDKLNEGTNIINTGLQKVNDNIQKIDSEKVVNNMLR